MFNTIRILTDSIKILDTEFKDYKQIVHCLVIVKSIIFTGLNFWEGIGFMKNVDLIFFWRISTNSMLYGLKGN